MIGIDFGFGALESLADLKRCYEFRMVIEPANAASAAERRTETDLGAIRHALEVMRDATDRRRHREDADRRSLPVAQRERELAHALGLRDHGRRPVQEEGRAPCRQRGPVRARH